MLECHIDIFKDATTKAKYQRDYVACILVRDTNVASLKFIGLSGFRPKPIECKAKTANAHGHRFSGLVVSPLMLPEAFRPNDLINAKKNWLDFEKVMRSRSNCWTVRQDGDLRGCVELNGKLLHGDYDLFDVIPVPKSELAPGNKLKWNRKVGHLAAIETLNGQASYRTWGIDPVKTYVNSKVRSPMVQHGAAMQFSGEFEQNVHVFTPDRTYRFYKNVESEFYKIYFPTRKPLDLYKRTEAG